MNVEKIIRRLEKSQRKSKPGDKWTNAEVRDIKALDRLRRQIDALRWGV